jgi:hypothetical protein
MLAGALVLSPGSLCPPFESCSYQNLFQQYFGIGLHDDNLTFVCAISTYKFAYCVCLCEQIQYWLSHEKHKFSLNASMPGRTSAWLFKQVHSHLVLIQDENSEAYDTNSKLCIMGDLILNLLKISNESLSEIDRNYHCALQKLLMCIKDGMLIWKESIARSNSYTCLQFVPCELYNIIFVAFHANPIEAHLNALHCIRLRFYWSSMYAYVRRMCHACLGCTLSNPTHGKSSELVYGFPIKAHSW